MLKPPHPVARLAYEMALRINPNNHALDGGRASSAMEKEAVADLAKMIGWETHLGHLCGGGTMANLEALWIAESAPPRQDGALRRRRRITPISVSPACSASRSKRFRAIDAVGWIVHALERRLAAGGVGTISRDAGHHRHRRGRSPDAIVELRRTGRCDFRVHADAAYGGYSPPRRQSGDGRATRVRPDRRRRLGRDRPAQARAAAVRLRLRHVQGSIGGSSVPATIRPTPTTRRPISTSARSRSSASAPEQRRSRCGPHTGCFPARARWSIRAGTRERPRGGADALYERLQQDGRFVTAQARPSSTFSSGRCARRASPRRQICRSAFL